MVVYETGNYPDIDGQPCYASLSALPERLEVVVVALGPNNTERLMPEIAAAGISVIWMPPGCFTPAAVEICRAAGVRELHDICPISVLNGQCM